MLLRQNVSELADFIRLMHQLGVEEVVVNNPAWIISRSIDHEKLFTHYAGTVDGETLKHLNKAREIAKDLGVSIYVYGVSCEEKAICPEDPLRMVFIDVDGNVSPCVYANAPIRGNRLTRYFMGKETWVNKVTFGNIRHKNIYEIWNSKEYRDFREIFSRRLEITVKIKAGLELDAVSLLNITLPKLCRTCYRIYGI